MESAPNSILLSTSSGGQGGSRGECGSGGFRAVFGRVGARLSRKRVGEDDRRERGFPGTEKCFAGAPLSSRLLAFFSHFGRIF